MFHILSPTLLAVCQPASYGCHMEDWSSPHMCRLFPPLSAKLLLNSILFNTRYLTPEKQVDTSTSTWNNGYWTNRPQLVRLKGCVWEAGQQHRRTTRECSLAHFYSICTPLISNTTLSHFICENTLMTEQLWGVPVMDEKLSNWWVCGMVQKQSLNLEQKQKT